VARLAALPGKRIFGARAEYPRVHGVRPMLLLERMAAGAARFADVAILRRSER